MKRFTPIVLFGCFVGHSVFYAHSRQIWSTNAIWIWSFIAIFVNMWANSNNTNSHSPQESGTKQIRFISGVVVAVVVPIKRMSFYTKSINNVDRRKKQNKKAAQEKRIYSKTIFYISLKYIVKAMVWYICWTLGKIVVYFYFASCFRLERILVNVLGANLSSTNITFDLIDWVCQRWFWILLLMHYNISLVNWSRGMSTHTHTHTHIFNFGNAKRKSFVHVCVCVFLVYILLFVVVFFYFWENIHRSQSHPIRF